MSQWKAPWSYSTLTLYINCTDEFHTLRHRVVRCICTIFLCAWSKKNVRLMYLCYNSVLQVSFVLHFCVKQRTFRFEKAASRQQKIYIMKKAIMLHSCISCHCTSCHFLIIQLDDENFNHMPSPIFCDVPLNHLLITT